MTEEPTIVMHIRVPPSLRRRLRNLWYSLDLENQSVAARMALEKGLDELEKAPRKRKAPTTY